MSRLNMAHSAPRLELRLHSPVQCQDGPAGALSHIVFHPCCGVLTHLVVRRSPFVRPRSVVVPVAYVDAITTEYVALNVPRSALHQLQAHAPARAPGPSPTSTQHIPPRNVACCTQTKEHTTTALLGKAQPVVCEDGRAGRLALVLFDPQTLRVLQLVIRHNRFMRRTTTVPLRWVDGITPQHIRLRALRHHLADLPPYHTDDEIADDVRYRLRIASIFRPHAEWLAINVSVHASVVLLHGNVRSRAHKQNAERIAQQTVGVRHVCNELITDDELARQVERALHTHTRFHARNIQVRVDLGLVELAGEVDVPDQTTRVPLIVHQVRGVRWINNLLRVVPSTERVSPAAARRSVVVQEWSHTAAHGKAPDYEQIDRQ